MDSKNIRMLMEAYQQVHKPIDEAVKGQDSGMRQAAAAERRGGDKKLSPSKGKGYADQQKQSISYMDKLTKKNKNVVGLVTKEEIENVDEATAMADRLPAVLQEKASASLDRVTQQVAADVKKEVPGLTPERVQSMSQQLVEGLALESEKLQTMLSEISQKETDRIELMLKKLPVTDAVKESEERLQQRFMHHILLLVDRAVAPDESILRSDAPFALDAPTEATN